MDKATGAAGQDGKTPEFKVENGNLMISTDGTTWSDLGNVTGATPVIKVEDGKWKVSTDGGTTWTEIAGSSTIGTGSGTSSTLGAPITGYVDSHAYVDLDLPSGKKWATMNVGAMTENAEGDYYAWGETDTKSDYSSSTSTTYGNSVSTLKSNGVLDETGTTLTAEYDVATVNWGTKWKMPTSADFSELLENCNWNWTELGGVKGYKVISKKDTNSWIFLPVTGHRTSASSSYNMQTGYYWSSTVHESRTGYAYDFHFDSSGKYRSYADYYGSTYYGHRAYGQCVRPVSE
ncbi:MAG: hypothetical protein MJZ33_02190 [Paludibacteraceae bacterium]|nr:hypothetical protein [Paludibacteraceae bacterium]